jgi:hypothetical protein
MNLSKIALFPMVALCVALIYSATQFGMSSLFKIGLENEIDAYDRQRVSLTSDDQAHRLTIINQLSNQLMNWDGHNPDHLALAAYVSIMNYFSHADDNELNAQTALEQSASYNQLSYDSRPLYSDTYAQQAYVMSYQHKPADEILSIFSMAQKFGPYESSTALAGLDILFAHWRDLSRDQRVKAVSYLTASNRYGVNYAQLNDLVATSAEKQKLCNVSRFAQLKLRACN